MSDKFYIDESPHTLCPDLYNQLRNTFKGGVIIANQGESCWHSSSVRPDGQVYTSIHHSGEYYRVNCPFCNDTRHRLWVNHMFGQADAGGRPMRFMAICYNEQCIEDYNNLRQLNEWIFGFKNAHHRNKPRFAVNQGEWVDPAQLADAEVPGTVVPMSQLARSMPQHPAVDYMCRERRYTLQMFDHYGISFCTYAPRYPAAAGRIIFPINMNGKFVGWQARYLGTTDWRRTPKYYGLPGMHKKAMLYNYDNAKDKPFVVLVEGPTDCHVVGDTSVALMGKNLSRYQTELVIQTWANKPIVLIFDPDAREEMRATVADLREAGAVVVEIVLPGEYDCGDYDRRTLWNIIHAQSKSMGVILPAV